MRKAAQIIALHYRDLPPLCHCRAIRLSDVRSFKPRRHADLPTRDSTRAVPAGRIAAPFVQPAFLTTNGSMYLRPMSGQSLGPRKLLTSSVDDCDVSRRSSPAAHARAPGPYGDTYAVAVNVVVVESDGSRPDRPDYLGGGGQARRHRAACNRGHGLLRGCVELM